MPIYKMKGKKDGLQKYRVRINYTDREGNPKQIDRVAYGNEEAKALERELNREIKNTSPVSNITISDLYHEYMAAKRHEVRETTLKKSEKNLEIHVLPAMGNIKLSKLSTPLLQKWKLEIEKKSLKLKTKQNIFGEFRALLNYAVKMEYLPVNPLPKVGTFKDAYHTKKEINYYTADEYKKYITAAKKEAEEKGFYEWNFYVFFNIAFYTGLRKGEIHALKWSDIDGAVLRVRRSVAQKLKGQDRETPPKNKSSVRDLQMPLPLIHILDEHKKRYEGAEGFTEEWRICGGLSCLRDTTVDHRNRHYAKLAGLKTIRIHDFRHSHASLLANEGINIQEIARRLGHSKIEMTWNTYSHLYPREEERAVNILNKIV